MKNMVLLLILGILYFDSSSLAACREHFEKNFTAKFEILKIENPQIECLFDEQGNILKDQPIKIEKEGCVLRLYVIKLKKGKLPVQEDWEKNKFSIYDNGPLCKKMVGDHFTKEIEYSGGECCVEREIAREGKQYLCKLTPTPVPVGDITEKYIRCSQKGVSWKFVN